VLYMLSQFFILYFIPEVVPVGLDSVMTVICPRDHRGQHFSLGTGEI
jgi:hypothetical protein